MRKYSMTQKGIKGLFHSSKTLGQRVKEIVDHFSPTEQTLVSLYIQKVSCNAAIMLLCQMDIVYTFFFTFDIWNSQFFIQLYTSSYRRRIWKPLYVIVLLYRSWFDMQERLYINTKTTLFCLIFTQCLDWVNSQTGRLDSIF